jgi:hypothetical protein
MSVVTQDPALQESLVRLEALREEYFGCSDDLIEAVWIAQESELRLATKVAALKNNIESSKEFCRRLLNDPSKLGTETDALAQIRDVLAILTRAGDTSAYCEGTPSAL